MNAGEDAHQAREMSFEQYPFRHFKRIETERRSAFIPNVKIKRSLRKDKAAQFTVIGFIYWIQH